MAYKSIVVEVATFIKEEVADVNRKRSDWIWRSVFILNYYGNFYLPLFSLFNNCIKTKYPYIFELCANSIINYAFPLSNFFYTSSEISYSEFIFSKKSSLLIRVFIVCEIRLIKIC